MQRALQSGANDLAQLLLVETLTGYGNDWFVIPIELPVGSLVSQHSLVVTDTFGVQTLVRRAGDPQLFPSHTGSSMFTHSIPGEVGETGPPSSNLFFLAPTVATLQGPVLEEVMLVRDPRVVSAPARILEAGDPAARLLIREEEVPREGVVVRRVYQAARWHDGRLFVWASNRASVGRGEASSGLTFDALEG
jgi:hypothetical protein